MPFQPVNFAGISPLGYSALRNMPQTIGQGMQVGMMPAQERRAAEKAALENALNKIRMQYLPQDFQSQIALRGAQAQKAQQESAQTKMLQDILQRRLGGQQQGGAPGVSGDEQAEQLFRHVLKLPSEYPSEKSAREVETARQKKEMESQYLTAPARTEHEEVISRAPQFIRGLQQLIDAPSPADIHIPFTNIRYRPAAYKQHESLVSDLGETFARLRGYPKGQAGQEKAISQLERASGETDFAYRKRLKKLFPEIARTVAESSRALNKPVPEWVNKILRDQQKSASQSLSSLNDAELRKIAFGGN